MRKEENTEKDELYGKLQVHFIENVEAEESSEEKESIPEIFLMRQLESLYRQKRRIEQRSQYKRI